MKNRGLGDGHAKKEESCRMFGDMTAEFGM